LALLVRLGICHDVPAVLMREFPGAFLGGGTLAFAFFVVQGFSLLPLWVGQSCPTIIDVRVRCKFARTAQSCFFNYQIHFLPTRSGSHE